MVNRLGSLIPRFAQARKPAPTSTPAPASAEIVNPAFLGPRSTNVPVTTRSAYAIAATAAFAYAPALIVTSSIKIINSCAGKPFILLSDFTRAIKSAAFNPIVNSAPAAASATASSLTATPTSLNIFIGACI